ncbi:hypothetical protein ASD64_06450 [Mesorhizobium sp. Root157]|nr:hypothetical protein ASD64_06450 [Mesorhizobium sp. Root157]
MDPRVCATAFGLLRPRMTKGWLHFVIATPGESRLGVFAPPLSSLATLVAGGDPDEWPDGRPRSHFIIATPGESRLAIVKELTSIERSGRRAAVRTLV